MTTGLKVRAGLLPPLQVGESVLYSRPCVWIASGKSFPSYRVTFSLPFIQEMGLYVTNRRVLLPYWLLRLVRLDWAAWFRGNDRAGDQDQIEEVSVGRSLLLGPYLQLTTCNPVGHWWRSRTARIRLYMKEPEPVCNLISERLLSASP